MTSLSIMHASGSVKWATKVGYVYIMYAGGSVKWVAKVGYVRSIMHA